MKISLALKGKPKSEAHRLASIAGNIGKTFSASSRLKMSLAKKGKPGRVTRYYRVEWPNGEVDYTFNMSAYCELKGLHKDKMSKLANGQSRYRGMRCEIISREEFEANT